MNKLDIVLSKIADERNKLNKIPYDVATYSGSFKQETSITKPVVIIEAENLSSYNYMYISEFGRYYFITDIVSLKTGLWRVHAKVDVLMSFKSSIESCPIVLSNTESTGIEKYMFGEMWKTLVKTKTDIISFSSGLNSTGEYILITSGG